MEVKEEGDGSEEEKGEKEDEEKSGKNTWKRKSEEKVEEEEEKEEEELEAGCSKDTQRQAHEGEEGSRPLLCPIFASEVPRFKIPNNCKARKLVGGSCVGGMKETQKMMDFAAEKGVKADVEITTL
ncbi:hypothetical protein V2J09_013121 [Rumex salicifolius]